MTAREDQQQKPPILSRECKSTGYDAVNVLARQVWRLQHECCCQRRQQTGWQDGGRVRVWQQTTVSTESRAEVRIDFSDGRTEETLQMVWKE